MAGGAFITVGLGLAVLFPAEVAQALETTTSVYIPGGYLPTYTIYASLASVDTAKSETTYCLNMFTPCGPELGTTYVTGPTRVALTDHATSLQRTNGHQANHRTFNCVLGSTASCTVLQTTSFVTNDFTSVLTASLNFGVNYLEEKVNMTVTAGLEKAATLTASTSSSTGGAPLITQPPAVLVGAAAALGIGGVLLA